MNYSGKCEHCGGDVYDGGEDCGSICTKCGATWRVDGVPLKPHMNAPARVHLPSALPRPAAPPGRATPRR